MQFSVYWLVISFLLFAWHFIAPQVPSVSGALTFVQLLILVLNCPPCCFATVLLLPPPFFPNWPHYGIRFHVIGLVARVYLRIQIKTYIHTYIHTLAICLATAILLLNDASSEQSLLRSESATSCRGTVDIS